MILVIITHTWRALDICSACSLLQYVKYSMLSNNTVWSCNSHNQSVIHISFYIKWKFSHDFLPFSVTLVISLSVFVSSFLLVSVNASEKVCDIFSLFPPPPLHSGRDWICVMMVHLVGQKAAMETSVASGDETDEGILQHVCCSAVKSDFNSPILLWWKRNKTRRSRSGGIR